MKTRLLAFLLVLGMFAFVPLAKANEWDKRTVVTFSNPVEIPGKVLPAGTYVMRLADLPNNRHVVQFFNQDETSLLATVIAVSDYRDQPTGDSRFHFEERRGNAPEALKSWFYPGDLYGLEFVY